MGNFEERFLSDKIFIRQAFYQTRFLSEKMGAYPTFLLLMLLTWTAQQSICQPHHGEPQRDDNTSTRKFIPFPSNFHSTGISSMESMLLGGMGMLLGGSG